MKNKINRNILYIMIFFVLSIIFLGNFHTVFASNCTSDTKTYCLLAPIGSSTSVDVSGIDAGDYFNFLIKVFMWIISVLAILMTIVGGIQYMTSFTAEGKGNGRARIQRVVSGLAVMLMAYTMLHIINPKLVNLSIGLPKVVLTVSPQSETLGSSDPTTLSTGDVASKGIYCPGSGGSSEIPAILASFSGHVTYRFGGGHGGNNSAPFPRDNDAAGNHGPYYCSDSGGTVLCSTFCPAGQICLDCSSFADMVETCAGISTPAGGGTGNLFVGGSAEKITSITQSGGVAYVNGSTLKNGDLLGWLKTDNPPNDNAGHVYIYSNLRLFEAMGGDAGRVSGHAVISSSLITPSHLTNLQRIYHSN